MIKQRTKDEHENYLEEQNAIWDMFDECWPQDNIKPSTLPQEVEQLELNLIEGAMSVAKKNKTKAAKALGISRENLIYKLRKYELG